MRVIASVVLLFAVVANVCNSQGHGGEWLTSFNIEGFDLIWSNISTFLDEMDVHPHGYMYVAGQTWLQVVNENPFELYSDPVFPFQHDFLDFKVFVDTKNNSWAFGPAMNYWDPHSRDPATGMNYPFSIIGSPSGSQHIVMKTEAPPGNYLMAAVALNNSYMQDSPVAYFAGWHQHHNASEGTNFTLIRTIVNSANAATNGVVFNYNHESGDRIYLHGEGFAAYTREFKPWMFHSYTYHHLVIVDPASRCVYRVYTPLDPTQPLYYNETTDRQWLFTRGNFVDSLAVVSATYDKINHRVYVGLQGFGVYPGMILVIDGHTMNIIYNYTLGMYESNPTALSLDFNNNLYVGLNGGGAILRINTNNFQAPWSTVGYATVPFYLRDVYDIAVRGSYVYILTREQHSKVARTPVANFCTETCDFLVGYCNAGQCDCALSHLYELGKDKRRCVEKAIAGENKANKDAKTYHGGEVALGLLFAIAFVAAVAGWYMVYRARGGRGFYSSLNSSERGSLLSGSD